MNVDTEVQEELYESEVHKWCENKTTKIIADIESFFNKYKDYKSMNVYPIFSNILSNDNKINKLKQRDFDNADDLEYCFQSFQKIIYTINLCVVFVPSIQLFCMFMGWTARIYKKMLNNQSEEICGVMQLVDEYIVENQFSAGQSGLSKQNLTKMRLQVAGEQGHNLVTQKEKNEDDRSKKKLKTKEELMKELINMGSVGVTVENADKLVKK